VTEHRVRKGGGGGGGGGGREQKKVQPSFMSDVKVDSVASYLSDPTRRALKEVFKFEYLTQVQAQGIPLALDGGDLLAKAKTGTGKTLGFLIPTVERLQNTSYPGIGALVLSPTRELANQIATEATGLTQFSKLKLGCVVGGTSKNKDMRLFDTSRNRRGNTDILIATPGRLIDHLENTPHVSSLVKSLQVLILDEADQLLDMGFERELKKILAFLPKENRQTLLFSATLPPDLKSMCGVILRPGYKFLNTVTEGETNVQVQQEMAVVPLRHHIHALAHALNLARKEKDHKIIVFFPTARVCALFAEIFRRSLKKTGTTVLEIHSRKSQSYRNTQSQRFREGTNVILFSSDVSARGVDYPDVTYVVQVGVVEKATYIHRLGRTARVGKRGKGLLLLCDFEEKLAKKTLRGLPIKTSAVNFANCPADEGVVRVAKTVGEEERKFDMSNVDKLQGLVKICCQGYVAWIAYYGQNLKKLGWDKSELPRHANEFSQILGLREPPYILKRTIGKMNLRGVRGFNIR